MKLYDDLVTITSLHDPVWRHGHRGTVVRGDGHLHRDVKDLGQVSRKRVDADAISGRSQNTGPHELRRRCKQRILDLEPFNVYLVFVVRLARGYIQLEMRCGSMKMYNIEFHENAIAYAVNL